MGKKNWLFSWTELGAKHIGIVQSLLATCRLHGINPYDDFVDVLQRVGHTRCPWCISSRHGSGRRCLPRIRYARTCMTLAAHVLMPSRDRLYTKVQAGGSSR